PNLSCLGLLSDRVLGSTVRPSRHSLRSGQDERQPL
ncbi:MAG TPA: hypothetical protein VFQ42_06935, partial [Mycobacterium sp.]|nr:hypothetical protein [Mycobacterium sp.]